MTTKLLTKHNLEHLSLKRGCRGSSESTLIKMLYCWKYHVAAQLCYPFLTEFRREGFYAHKSVELDWMPQNATFYWALHCCQNDNNLQVSDSMTAVA